MIETILADFTAEVLVLIVASLGTVFYKNRKNISKLSNRILKLEQRLFGLEEDETDEGYLKESSEKLEHIEKDVTSVEENVREIDSKVNILVENINDDD